MNRRSAEKLPMILVSGSCINFEKERAKILEVLDTLELATRKKGDMQCSSVGKKYLGWDFFYVYFAPELVNTLVDLYPNILKQEANTIEEMFVLWLDKQFAKKNLKYNLKLTDVPREQVRGFKLDPENYRSDEWMEKYR